jgi:hypothetical protein
MRTEIKVLSFTHDDLVNLLSTALYGSSWFYAEYDRTIYDTLKKTKGDCFEDKLADMLLAGHKITIVDMDAEGVKYSDKCVRIDAEDESAVYEVKLEDFLQTASTKDGYGLVTEVLSGDGDFWTADAFLQRVVFGEEVYG